MLEVQLIGNLGNDPEARYTPEGALVVSFRVATTRRWTDRSGHKHEETTWVDVSAWGGLAETCHQHLAKGRQVFVRGRPEVRAFTRKDGTAGAALQVTASEVMFLGAKPQGEKAEVDEVEEVPF
jgi:single-strand DNA-binding protein